MSGSSQTTDRTSLDRESATLHGQRAGDDHLRLAVEAAGLGTWESNLLTGQIVWSARLRSLYGMAHDRPASVAAFLSVVHPDDRARVEAMLAELTALDRASDFQEEYRIVRPDGTVRWMAIRGHVYVGVVGGRPRAVRLAGAVLDVTDRKETEEALRASERRFRAAADHFPSAFVIYDAERRYRFVNERMLRAARLPLDQVLGRRDEDLLPWELARLWVPRLEEAVRERRTVSFEVTLPARWLRGHAFAVTYVPLPGPNGETAQVLGITWDVTDRRRSEQLLRESERRSHELIDAIPQLVWTCRPDGSCDYVNRQYVEYTGMPLANHLGDGWVEAVHPEDRPRLVEQWHGALARGTDYDKLFRVRGADGRFRWFRARAHPMRDREGRLVRWFGTSTDVDDQVRAEQGLKEAGRRKDEFMALLGHELRNPLAPIRNSLFVLRQAAATPQQRTHALEVLDRQARHLTRLVEDLLDVSRITRGKVSLRREPLDLARLVAATLRDQRCLFDRRALRLELEVSSEPLEVDGDATRLAQVVGNLLQNAAKFTEPGGAVRVEVHAAGAEALIRVADTGVGMEQALLERLFQPFSQGERTLARSQGGLGLGLALVKALVEMHGGTVRAFSPGRGAGSCFEVRLPLTRAPAHAARESAPPLPADGP